MRSIEFAFRIADPADSLSLGHDNKYLDWFDSIALFLQILVELILILTMHKLAIALRLITGDIN